MPIPTKFILAFCRCAPYSCHLPFPSHLKHIGNLWRKLLLKRGVYIPLSIGAAHNYVASYYYSFSKLSTAFLQPKIAALLRILFATPP